MNETIEVGRRRIGRGEATFVVAEMACAHEGSPERALAMVEALAASGVDAIQLQIFQSSELIAETHPNFELVEGLELSPDAWRPILAAVRNSSAQLWVNVFDLDSLRLAVGCGADLLKLHSTDLGHPALLDAVAEAGLPVSLGVGGSTDDEILGAVERLRAADVPFLLMHGFQAYPTPVEETRLARIPILRRQFGCPVGFGDHSHAESRAAWLLPAAAVGVGAAVIEKHVVDDRMRGGVDHEAAFEAAELSLLVGEIASIDRAIGSGVAAPMSDAELAYRRNFKRAVVAARPIEAGETILGGALSYLRCGTPGTCSAEDLVGKIALHDIARHEPVELDEVMGGYESCNEPRVVACIAVRMGSTRLPGKALLPIDGVPMLRRLIDRVRSASCVDEIVVCTSQHPDDEVLVERALEWGVSAYAGSERDVLSRFIEAGEQAGADLVVRITGDNVLTDPEAIDALVELQQDTGAEYTRVAGLPLGVTPELMTLPFLRRLHASMEDPEASEYLIFFAFDPEQYRCSVLYAQQDCRRPSYALTVDTPADLALMERIFSSIPCGPAGPAVADVCRWLDAAPDYTGVADDAPIKLPDGVTWSFADYLRWHGETCELCTAIEVAG